MPDPAASKLGELLEQQRNTLLRRVRADAGWLLRHETADDLVQGVFLTALQAGSGFTWQGDAAFDGWLRKLTRSHLRERALHWRALKRDAGTLLHIATRSPESVVSRAFVDPTSPGTGPITFALRREFFAVAMDAAETLGERDRKIVALGRDATVDDVATELEISLSAAQRAKLRALERFETSFRVLARERGLEGSVA